MVRRLRRVAPLAVALASAALFAADQPPSTLKYVNGHWTAWDPPASFPEGTKVHIVEPGDTFWDLAAANLGNPYLWPQLWEKNQYVLDAHWIYPGDPLVVGLEVAPAATGDLAAGAPGGAGGVGAPGGGGVPGAPGGVGAGEADETVDVGGAPGSGSGAAGGAGMVDPGARGLGSAEEGAAGAALAASAGLKTAPAGGARSVPVPLGSEDDIYCYGYVGEVDESFSYSVIGSEYEVLSPALVNVAGEIEGVFGTVDTVKVELTTGDLVYVDGGRGAGLTPGAIFTAVLPGARVVHPVTGETFGRQYDYRGRVRILSVSDETAIGEVVQSCLGLRVGSLLKPYVPEPVPLARRTPMRPVNDPTSAAALEGAPVILASPSRLITLGQDHVVYLDKGELDDVLPGDVFTIYRPHQAPKPPVVVGELAVLSVQSRSALARILESRYPVYVGDRLERK
jgi:hypothetical protein